MQKDEQTMPRPKGSKNKATQAKMSAKTSMVTKETAPKSVVAPESVEGTLLSYEKMLTSYNEQITGLLSELLEEFDGLKVLVGGATASPAKTTAKPTAKKPAVVEEEDDDEDETEDEDEPDFDSMTVEELEEFVEDYDLDVDLDAYKGLSKKRQAVSDAYEETSDADTEDDDEDETEDDDEDETEEDWDSPPKAAASKPKRGRR